MIDVITAEPGHRDDVLALLAAQLEEHDIPLSRERLETAVDGMLAHPERGRILLAVDGDGDTAAGVAYVSFTWSLEHGGRTAWLEELYVQPERRCHGTGARLLMEVIDLAKKNGCAAVDLEVESSHGRAANLYARSGFQRHQRERWVRFLK